MRLKKAQERLSRNKQFENRILGRRVVAGTEICANNGEINSAGSTAVINDASEDDALENAGVENSQGRDLQLPVSSSSVPNLSPDAMLPCGTSTSGAPGISHTVRAVQRTRQKDNVDPIKTVAGYGALKERILRSLSLMPLSLFLDKSKESIALCRILRDAGLQCAIQTA
eukprot:IDg16716t1